MYNINMFSLPLFYIFLFVDEHYVHSAVEASAPAALDSEFCGKEAACSNSVASQTLI